METGRKGTLTQEQMAQIRQYGKGASVKDNSQNLNSKTQMDDNKQPSSQPVQQQTGGVQVDMSYENNEVSLDYEEKAVDAETYFEFKAKNNSKLEFDLVTFREKGVETRYLSISINWPRTLNGNKEAEYDKTMITIGSKEDFEELKKFIGQLNWGD